ncbi:MAG TPA: cytochrome c-type biogenesis CcmF C-terminal domain-containing protein [Thermoanaerobaculia bacterium]|nr:cytochrome c-type biogenesis CcmF C-terminal domain-containing protein [Thermoanaerobaculia bacterium]
MTPLLGRTLILLSLLAASSGAVVAFAAASRPRLLEWARRFAFGYAALIIAANVVMVAALVGHDFSVSYVARVGSRSTPLWVTIVSLWSSLEGSILFWGMVLGLFIGGATFATRRRHEEYMPYAIGTWLAVAAFFSFLIAGPAQPFNTVVNPPADGPGPNPLLQNHILMAVHPPFLYFGFVGMTIPFGFASAALMLRRLGDDFLQPLRTSLLVAWTFLSVAIVLGGWWAYEVLGWGGYWAWDPVENASFLPWLVATAALHSAIVVERKGTLKGWTLTLVMSSFLLVILGTFMTRSGVFNSVHSFTQSEIGPTILGFLAVALLWSVALLAGNMDRIEGEAVRIEGASREGMFLINNLLFVLFTLTVLIGTVFPLLVEAVQDRQISVGRPYFDKMAVPIGAALLFLMGIGPALPWGRATRQQVERALLPPLLTAGAVLVLGALLGATNPWTLLTLFFGGYAIHVTMREMLLPVAKRVRGGDSPGRAFVEAQLVRGRRRFGSYIVHGSVILIMAAIAVSSTMKVSAEQQLRQGETMAIGDYTLRFFGAETRQEPHRLATIAHIGVYRGEKLIRNMQPRMNQYLTQREPIGTPDVYTRFRGDLYLSVMNIDPRAQTVGLHAIINPMVGWIWIATGTLALGAIVLLIPRRKSAAGESVALEASSHPSPRTRSREPLPGDAG